MAEAVAVLCGRRPVR